MAIRRGLSAGISGGAASAAESMQKLIDEHAQARGEQRRATLAMLKDTEDKVASGALEPEQANSLMTARGFRVPPGHFESLQPSHENQLKRVMQGMTAAASPQEVPGPMALSYSMPGGPKASMSAAPGVGPMKPPTPDATTGQNTLPSQDIAPIQSPEFQSLMGARTEKLNSFNAVPVANTDEAGNEITQYKNPTQLTGLTTRPKPTAEQAGTLEATKTATGLRTALGLGTPELEGESKRRESLANEYSPEITKAKATQEGATAKSRAQAELDVQGSPQALELKRKQETITHQVAQAFKEQGLSPEFAASFVHHTDFGSYVDESEIPADQRDYIVRATASAIKAGVPVKILNGQRAVGMGLIQRAYDNYNLITNIVSKYASENAAARIVGGPANTLAGVMQTNPELASLVTDFAATLETGAAQMQGLRGLRMGADLVNQMVKSGQDPTQTLPTVLNKLRMTHQLLRNTALSLYR